MSENINKNLIEFASYSKISTFLCPYKFKLNYGCNYRLRNENNIWGCYGSAIHNAIEQFFLRNDKNRKNLISSWKDIYNKQVKLECLHPDEGLNSYLLKNGYQLLNNFFSFFSENDLFEFKKAIPEYKFYVKFNNLGTTINGKIDLILDFENCYVVIDHKTSKNMDAHDEQFLYYFIGLLDYIEKHDLPMKKVKFAFFYLRHKKLSKVEITKDELIKFLKELKKKLHEIDKSLFEEKKCSLCNWCEFKKLYCMFYNNRYTRKNKLEKFNKKLYEYQFADVDYMISKQNVLNANDMGLGKTVEVIYMGELLYKKEIIKKILVITPNSLKYQWEKEIKECLGNEYDNYQIINGGRKIRYKQYKKIKLWTIVNYETFNIDFNYYKQYWDIIVLDEATKIKNFKAQVSKKVKKLQSNMHIALTGTPIENRIEELYSIMQFVNRNVFSNWMYFNSKFIERGFFNNISGYKNINELKKKIDEHYFRHTREEVKNDLPKCIENNYLIELSDEQKRLYNKIINSITNIIKNKKNIDDTIDKNTLTMIVYLREVCNSTELLKNNLIYSSKVNELKEILKNIDIINNKIIVFSQYKKMIDIIERELCNDKKLKIGKITGETKIKDRQNIINKLNNGELDILLSTDCSAYGVNLQKANILINFDISWNPATLKQRIGRVYRIGQEKIVNIINFITKNTIEERIIDIINYKQSLFDSVFNDENIDKINAPKSKKMTYRELGDLLK